MASPILSDRAINRAVLARQSLLARSELPLTRLVERVGGLQTQYAPSGYVGWWTRAANVERDALTRALEQGRVVQGTLMRATIHMVSARDYPLFAAGLRSARRAWWLRAARGRGVADCDYEALARLLRAELADGPRPRADLIRAIERAGHPKAVWEGAGLWLDLLRVPPSGTWERRRADLYGLAEATLGARSPTEDEGLAHLLRRYLGAFGPAPLADAASWAGVPRAELERIAPQLRLRRLRDERGAELVDLARAPRPAPDTPAPVRFLPTWDAVLLVHARRARVLPEELRPRVFNTKSPQSVGTFLVDGSVAGTWRFDEGRVRTESFVALSRAAQREVDDEAERLAVFHR